MTPHEADQFELVLVSIFLLATIIFFGIARLVDYKRKNKHK